MTHSSGGSSLLGQGDAGSVALGQRGGWLVLTALWGDKVQQGKSQVTRELVAVEWGWSERRPGTRWPLRRHVPNTLRKRSCLCLIPGFPTASGQCISCVCRKSKKQYNNGQSIQGQLFKFLAVPSCLDWAFCRTVWTRWFLRPLPTWYSNLWKWYEKYIYEKIFLSTGKKSQLSLWFETQT